MFILDMHTLIVANSQSTSGEPKNISCLKNICISIDSSSFGLNSCRNCYGFAFALVNACYYVGSRCRVRSIRLANAWQSPFSGVNQDVLAPYSNVHVFAPKLSRIVNLHPCGGESKDVNCPNKHYVNICFDLPFNFLPPLRRPCNCTYRCMRREKERRAFTFSYVSHSQDFRRLSS
jgi:hypothetical protein